MCLSAAEAVGGGEAGVLDAACAIEMVHAFSLVHDDLPAIDNDDLRRGRPTCHAKFGEAMAILAGDALFALAFQVLTAIPLDSGRVLRAANCLGRASGSSGLVGGEVVDVLSEGRPVDPETLDYIHSKKTGSLMSAACEIGGLLGGGETHQIVALRHYGLTVGIAFQIADDLLNELSTAEVLGKATGSDRRRQKATYPGLHGIDRSRQEADRRVDQALDLLREEGLETEMLVGLARYAVERLN
jgi:geranylgeranyl diphosphate synthase, type II